MRLLIIGGSGTLGNAVTEALYSNGRSISIYSRDEIKQKEMKKKFPKCNFIIGDVRDKEAVENAVRGHDRVFLFAASKHVDICERFPEECIKTNIDGCLNTLKACDKYNTPLTFSSTDKAVAPVNAYGASKMMCEKILLGQDRVKVSIARYGNVLGSRGSVLEMFVKSILTSQPVCVTDERCTRFWIKIEDAARFVINANEGMNIPKLRSSKITDLVYAVSKVLGKPYSIKVTGLIPGEKVHESLSEDYHSNTSFQYTLDELTNLIEPIVKRFI